MKRLAALFAVFLTVSVIACGSDSSPSTGIPNPTKESHPPFLRIQSGEPVTLDPHLVTDIGSHAYVSKIFSGLVRLVPAFYDKSGNLVASGDNIPEDVIVKFKNGEYTQSGVVVPDLATALPEPELNPDGTVSYIFTIRDDAKFASGKKITAWDIAYSLDRAADPRTLSTTAELYLGDIVGVMDMQRGRIINRVAPDQGEVWVDLPGVKVLDDQTIRITIDAPKAYFLMKLTYPVAFVVNKVQTETVRNWTDRPDGSGPYRLIKKEVNEIVMEANPNYYGVQPKIKKLVFQLSGGSSYPRYQAGEVDFAGIGVADLELLEEVRDKSSELHQQYFEAVEMSTSYIGFNTTRPPFDDPKVRRAFAMAVDREAIAHNVLHDLVLPAKGILPPGMPGYRDDLNGIPYDPPAAKALLAESNYAGNMPRLKLTTSGGDGAPSVVLQSIVEFWRTNLGLDVEIEQLDYVTFLQEIRKGNFQMFSLGWVADYPDPEDFLDLKFYSGRSIANNETQYRNPEVDELLLQARTEPDNDKRIVLYQQAEDIILKDVPWLPLFHGKTSLLVKPYVCGYFPTPLGISVIHLAYFCD